MNKILVSLICDRLINDANVISMQSHDSMHEVWVRYAVINEFFPDDLAHQINKNFPLASAMRLMSGFCERKYISNIFEKSYSLMANINFAIQNSRVISIVEEVTGIKYHLPDSKLYADGLISMTKGHFLGSHIENYHDGARQNYRTLNLLYYASPDWALENGGNLELWDKKVKRNATIAINFNRLIITEKNPWFRHSVSEVNVDRERYCLWNYYFLEFSPTWEPYFNITDFSARPEQNLLRAVA